MKALRWPLLALLTAATLTSLLIAPGDSQAGDDPPLDVWDGTYAGLNSGGLPTVVHVNSDDTDNPTASLFTIVPGMPCGLPITLILPSMPIDEDGEFHGSAPNGGGGGQLDYDDVERSPAGEDGLDLYVVGSASAFTQVGEQSCSGGAGFELDKVGTLKGDVDCSWEDVFDEDEQRALAQPAVPAQSLFGGVAATDALNTLKYLAGILSAAAPASASEGCPPIGSELPDGTIFGDTDCDGDVDAVDALNILKLLAGFPISLPIGCSPVGEFVVPA
jgi:hypothetical protein